LEWISAISGLTSQCHWQLGLSVTMTTEDVSLSPIDIIWTSAFSIGVIQGLFISMALATAQSRNRIGARALAALSAVMTLMIVTELLELLQIRPLHLWVNAFAINGELLFGPLCLQIALSMVGPVDRSLMRPAFIAFVLASMVWLTLITTLGAEAFNDDVSGAVQPWVTSYLIFKSIYLFAFFALGYRTLRSSHNRQAVLIRRFIVASAGCCIMIYANFFANLSGWASLPDSDFIGSVLLAVLIYSLSWMVTRRPELLSAVPRAEPSIELREQWEPRIREFFEVGQGHLDMDLSLSSMAHQLDLTENRLSDLLNGIMQASFNELVNQYRVKAFEKQLERPQATDKTILEMAMDAGFSSKASFYRVFRAHHQMSPIEYQKKHHSRPSSEEN
jgi:AraC-like DNA-binding protein